MVIDSDDVVDSVSVRVVHGVSDNIIDRVIDSDGAAVDSVSGGVGHSVIDNITDVSIDSFGCNIINGVIDNVVAAAVGSGGLSLQVTWPRSGNDCCFVWPTSAQTWQGLPHPISGQCKCRFE